MQNEEGFTLIELVIVIVILGILAAAAIPKYVDMTNEARQSAVDGIAGSLNSASAVNYAGDLAKGAKFGTALTSAPAITGITDTSAGCTSATIPGLVPNAPLASTGAGTYAISGTGTLTNIGDTVQCTVTSNDDNTKTATFTLYGAK